MRTSREKGGDETLAALSHALPKILLPPIRQLQASGIRTVRALAVELNARGVRTAAQWHPTTVHNLLTRGAA